MSKAVEIINLLTISFAPIVLLIIGLYFWLDFSDMMLLCLVVLLQQIAFDTFWMKQKMKNG